MAGSAPDYPFRVAVVTGASASIGRATAVALARAGCDVAVVVARDAQRLHSLCKEIQALGQRSLAISVDVSDADGVV